MLNLEGLVIIWNAFLFVHRLKALSPDNSVGVRYSKLLLGFMSGGFFLSRYYEFVVHQVMGNNQHWFTMSVFLALSINFAGTYAFYTASITSCLIRSSIVLRREAGRLHGAPRAEAQWASNLRNGT